MNASKHPSGHVRTVRSVSCFAERVGEQLHLDIALGRKGELLAFAGQILRADKALQVLVEGVAREQEAEVAAPQRVKCTREGKPADPGCLTTPPAEPTSRRARRHRPSGGEP